MKSLLHYLAPNILIFIANMACAETNVIYWIATAKAELHAEASAASAVVHSWEHYTPIIKKAEQGEWCSVTDVNETLAGFIRCDQMITDHQKQMNIFWDNPSVENLIYFASYLEQSLTEDQRQAEYTFIQEEYLRWYEKHDSTQEVFEVPIKRQANADFDAMKAILAKGVKVEKDLSLAPHSSSLYFQKLDQFQPNEIYEVGEYIDELLNKSVLPPIKPSLFLSANDLLFPAATSAVDDLSVVAKSTLSAKVAKPIYGAIMREVYVAGYWDIGNLEITLADPLAMYSVAKNGLVGKQTGKVFEMELSEGYCDYGMPLYLPNDIVAADNYPAIEYPLVQFYTQKNISPKVHIRTQSYQLRGASPEKANIKVHVHAVDLNADNSADIAITESAIPAYYEGDTKTWVTYFVNLNGEWYFAFSFVTPECT